jgi:malate synthase
MEPAAHPTTPPVSSPTRPELVVVAPSTPAVESILTPAALSFLTELVVRFGPRRARLLTARQDAHARFRAGDKPRFSTETKAIRDGDWTVAPLPPDLLDRRVEITGPVDRKMIINALNSGASVFMADFEDSTAPTWSNLMDGQVNLRDAVLGTIDFTHPRTGKAYSLNETRATLMVRPRGWHLPEHNVLLDGVAVSGSLVDFGLFFFHNARQLVASGSGPYFYLPKIEHWREAELWNDVFVFAQQHLNISLGTIKATVLIETLTGAFHMDEILYALRQHSAGLNCGRWDYIFSVIKTLGHDPAFVLPDRAAIGMTQTLMRSYSRHVIRTCHRRGVHAMGGMAAQIPIKNDVAANDAAIAKVRADKEREVADGHDGTWVAHPGLVPLARQVFDEGMPQDNQLTVMLPPVDEAALTAELLQLPDGPRTEAGLRQNVNVGLLYLEAWLRGAGCVPLYNLMEDAATAEISRTQLWQWVKHRAPLDDGRTLSPELFTKVLAEEVDTIASAVGPERFNSGRFAEARDLFMALVLDRDLADFLTLPAYDLLATTTAR